MAPKISDEQKEKQREKIRVGAKEVSLLLMNT